MVIAETPPCQSQLRPDVHQLFAELSPYTQSSALPFQTVVQCISGLHNAWVTTLLPVIAGITDNKVGIWHTK